MCLFTNARTVAIVFARSAGGEAMYCAGVLTFDGGFMDSSLKCPPARTPPAPLSARERKTATRLRNRAEWHRSSPTSPARSSLLYANLMPFNELKQDCALLPCCTEDRHSMRQASRVLRGPFQSSEKFDNCPRRGATPR